MLRRFGLALAFLLLAACQSYDPPPHVAAPPLKEGYAQRSKPVPAQNPPPPPRAQPAPRRYGSTPRHQYNKTRQYAQSRSSGRSSLPQALQGKVAEPAPRSGAHATAGSRQWVPSAPAHNWRWIVIHHSDTREGSAASFDRYHRKVHHWDELGYHFVIDNGHGGPDGRVEVGPRWKKQKWGAHAGVAAYNEYGIGICLVGDFNSTRPTPAQMRSLSRLVAYLMQTYHIPASRVIGHRDAKRTDCPGRYLNLATVRQAAAAYAGLPEPGPSLAMGELLQDVKPSRER